MKQKDQLFFILLRALPLLVTIFAISSLCYAKDGEVREITDPKDYLYQNLEIDVSGRHGISSPPGEDHDGYGRASRNQRGRGGGKSPEPSPGTEAGEIDLEFGVEDGSLSLFGYSITNDGIKKPIRLVLDWGVKLRTVIRGGNGGSGNRGGNGQQGGKGTTGSDATPSSSAGNGGPGAEGGPAGEGSSGANAGSGGRQRIGVPESVLEALLLIKTRAESALGGSKGCHGIPGDGGPGGDGGAGCTWTETESYTTTETDSDGKSKVVTKTRTVVRSRPPGSTGRRGPRGRVPSKVLRDGDDGAPGKVIFNVRRADGTTDVYTERFLLQLADYELEDQNGDKIIEPGEEVLVKNLTIRNVGQMELPHDARIFISFGDSVYTISEQIELEVPNGLPPGESYTFEEPMSFTCKKGIMFDAKPEPFKVEDSIIPTAMVESAFLYETLPEFRTMLPFEIKFPIEIEGITTLSNLALGEATRFTFKITNKSKIAYGSDSEIQRAVQYWIKRKGGDLNYEQLQFFSPDGNQIDIAEAFTKEIRQLGPEDSVIVEGIVGMRPDADLYRTGVINLGLEMDTHNQELQHIQHPLLVFNASADYFSPVDREKDFLLIANKDFSRTAYETWKEEIDAIDSRMAIFDLSYYSFLELLRNIAEDDMEGGSSLARDFAGKTIILPDHEFEYENGQVVRATDFLHQNDLVLAQEKYGIKFLVLSDRDESVNLFENLRYGTPDPRMIHRYRVTSTMVDEVTNSPNYTEENDTNYTHTVWRSSSTKRYIWSSPKNRKPLEKRANKIARQLQIEDSENDYYVVHRYNPRLMGSWGRFLWIDWFRKYNLGHIEIRKKAKKPNGLGVHIQAPEYDINSGPFIQSEEVLTSMHMLVDAEKRINLLKKYISGTTYETSLIEETSIDDETGEETSINSRPSDDILTYDMSEGSMDRVRFDSIIDSFRFGLMNEIMQVHLDSWKNNPSKKELEENLPTLKAISEMAVGLNVNTHPYVVEQFVVLASMLKAFGDSQVGIWEKILPGHSLNEKVRKLLDEGLKSMIENSFGTRSHRWSSIGRFFQDQEELDESGFNANDISTRVSNLVNEFKAHWKDLSPEEVANQSLPSPYRTGLVESKTEVYSGEEIDEFDRENGERDLEVISNSEQMGKSRDELRVDNPDVVDRINNISPTIRNNCEISFIN